MFSSGELPVSAQWPPPQFVQAPAQQGWQCPVCKHVYSPSTAVCFYCPPKIESTSTTASEPSDSEEE